MQVSSATTVKGGPLACAAGGSDVTVRAAVIQAPGRFAVASFPTPDPEPGAVLLRMHYSGICGTDKHTWRGESLQYAGTEHERGDRAGGAAGRRARPCAGGRRSCRAGGEPDLRALHGLPRRARSVLPVH